MAGIRLTFWGAAGQVTGSMHLFEAAGARVLLDGGLFQGHRAEARDLNASLQFDPRRIDAIVLSHAHIDHNGRLPLLVARGFHGPIYATPPKIGENIWFAASTSNLSDGKRFWLAASKPS